MKFKVESARYHQGRIEVTVYQENFGIFTVQGNITDECFVIEEGEVHEESTEEDREIKESEIEMIEEIDEVQTLAYQIYQECIAPDEYDYYLGMSNENY